MCEIGHVIIFCFLLFAAVSDLRTRKISTMLLIGMSVVVSFLCLFLAKNNIFDVIGGFGIGMLFFVISKCTKEAIGYGDSWIMSLLGVYLGGSQMIEVLMIAFLFAGVFSLVGMVCKKWINTSTIPFIPFLTIAYLGVVIV